MSRKEERWHLRDILSRKPDAPGPMPFLPEPRRPLTPTSSLHSAATNIGPLFAKLPNELLYDILRLTFGVSFIHIELDYEYAPSRVPPKKGCHDLGYAGRYSTRIRDEIPSPVLKRGQPRWTLNVSKRHPRRWRWFGCNCQRITNHFDVPYFCDEPWQCQCKYGSRPNTSWAEVTRNAPINAMGWLLSCRRAYAIGIDVLYSTNTFHLTSTQLILNLPRLIPRSHIGMMTSLEMRWKIHPFRAQDAKDPPLSDYAAFETLVRETPQIFPSLGRLYISLQGDLFLPEGPGGDVMEPEKLVEVEERLLRPLEGMLRSMPGLRKAVIAVPSSVYREQKRRAFRDEARMTQRKYLLQERIWRPLDDAAIQGFWLALGHRDLKYYPRRAFCNLGFTPVDPFDEDPFVVLHEFADSPWA